MIVGESLAQRTAREERQRERFPDIGSSDIATVFEVDNLRRTEGRTPTSFGQEVESVSARLRPPSEEHPAGTLLNAALGPVGPYGPAGTGGDVMPPGAPSPFINPSLERVREQFGDRNVPDYSAQESIGYGLEAAGNVGQVLGTSSYAEAFGIQNPIAQELTRPINYLPIGKGVSVARAVTEAVGGRLAVEAAQPLVERLPEQYRGAADLGINLAGQVATGAAYPRIASGARALNAAGDAQTLRTTAGAGEFGRGKFEDVIPRATAVGPRGDMAGVGGGSVFNPSPAERAAWLEKHGDLVAPSAAKQPPTDRMFQDASVALTDARERVAEISKTLALPDDELAKVMPAYNVFPENYRGALNFQLREAVGALEQAEYRVNALRPNKPLDNVVPKFPFSGMKGGAFTPEEGGGIATDVPFRPRIAGAAVEPDLADVRTFATKQGTPVRTPDEVLTSAQSEAARLYAAAAQKADEPVYGGIVDALEQASAAVRTDPQGVVSRLAGKIPGLRAIRDWDRPGLTMEKRLLEGHIARRGVEGALVTGQSTARYDAIRLVDEVLGEGAASGARVLDDLRVTGQHAVEVGGKMVEYPGSGTVYDLLQRPYAYQVGDDVRRVAEQWAKTDEGMRALLNERFGADIGHFVPARGGVYVPNVNVSEARQATLENIARGESFGISGTGKSKTRVFETGFDRWANDMKRAQQGIIKPNAVFTPETDLRVLGYTADMTKAKAAGNLTMRAATGGRSISEVKEIVAPGLVQQRGTLRKGIDSLRGRIQRAEQAMGRDATVASRLETQARQTAGRTDDLSGRVAAIQERQQLALRSPSSGISSDDLPEFRVLEAQSQALRAQLRRNASGQILDNADNRRLIGEIADVELRADVRGAVDNANGDPFDALQQIDEANRRLGNAVEVRGDKGLTLRRGDIGTPKQRRRGTMPGEEMAVRESGEPDLAILRARSERLDAFLNDVEIGGGTAGQDVVEQLDSAIRELDRRAIALERAASGPATRADLASQALPMLREDLLALKDEYADVKRAYDAVGTQDFVQPKNLPGRYFPSSEARQIDEMLRPAKDNVVTRVLEGWRSQVLAGDIGPLTGIQGLIAAASGRAGTTRAVVGALADGLKGVAKGEPGALLKPYTQDAMEQFIRENAELVQEYAFYTGRNVGGRLPAEVGQGGLLAKIPGFVDANEGMFNVATRRQIEMFRRVKDDLVKAGYSPEEGAAAAADLSNKVIPLMTPARLGQSAAQAQEQRFLPTSLGFIRQPLALTEEAFSTLGKVAAGQSVTPREKLALSIYAQMIGNLSAVAVTSAGINALARDDDPVDAMLNALDPNSRSFMAVSIGGQTIPLATPFRAPLRVGIGTIRNILNAGVQPLTGVNIGQEAGASPIDYATNRIGPPARAGLGVAKEITAAPWERKYQGDNDILRLMMAGAIAAGGAAPIPVVGIGEEVVAQAKEGEFDPLRLATVAGAETASLSLVPEEPVRTLDVKAQAAHGVPFTELTPKEQSAILRADPKLAEASERQRRERVAGQLEEAGYTDIAPKAWAAIRSLDDTLPADYKAYREAKMPALEEIARTQGNADPSNAAAQMFGRLTAVKQYRDVLESRRKTWALEHAKDGLAQLAVDYDFLDSNADIRRILTAVEPVR